MSAGEMAVERELLDQGIATLMAIPHLHGRLMAFLDVLARYGHFDAGCIYLFTPKNSVFSQWLRVGWRL